MTEKETPRKRRRSTIKVENVEEEPAETIEASERLIRNIVQAGRNLVMVPIRLLPSEPQKHFENAGNEFVLGVSALTREVLDAIEKMTDESE
jgi:hypothetical protein